MPVTPHVYDRLFYQYQREGSYRSAMAVLPHVIASLAPRSVLDVGCGAGAWLAAYRRLGVPCGVGVDGDYLDPSMLMIDETSFEAANIANPLDLRTQFDLVQCLEVAEHVPASASETLLDNIARHGKQVLFSAAVPGQGGENHINERPREYWRDRFAARGYRLYDFVRPLIAGNRSIEPWYRYNLLFFAHESVADSLPFEVRRCAVPASAPIADHSPWMFRLQKQLLRGLPHDAVTQIAIFKHKLALRSLARR